jgi:hypothetical protein
MQSESLQTGLPTPFFGPGQVAANHVYSITNSLTSAVNGTFTTAPLATTSFQAGMHTPVDLKTIASLMTYYPSEVIFFALIDSIDVKSESQPYRYSRLFNNPGQGYFSRTHPSDLDQARCNDIINHSRDAAERLFHEGNEVERICYYAKFVNLLELLIEYGLDTDLVQIPAPQPAQAQANQSNIITVGKLCRNMSLVPPNLPILKTDLPICGGSNKDRDNGGTKVTTRVENHKANDVTVRTDTESITKTITTTQNSIVPVGGRGARFSFEGVGWVELTFNLRPPNSFLNYLASWYNFGSVVAFTDANNRPAYRGLAAQRIFSDGPYLSIAKINGPDVSCYSSATYDEQAYCVPSEATHTSMLMDLAVILRNLNITPQDLNAPVSVRVTD